MKRKKKWSFEIISFFCVELLISGACTTGLNPLSLKKNNTQIQETTQSQYWALLFAVGEYENAPGQDRPSMLQACDDLYNVLIDSPQFWQASNIRTVKSSQAILQNLIKELLWLRKNARNEDYVLVYITTHGNHLMDANGQPLDLPPKDETDGSDEILMMYNGFNKWYGIIWDDMLNFLLSIIKCKGLCLIVDSCYSGGFNDVFSKCVTTIQSYNAESFTIGFADELAFPGRVVLMSCQENEVSYGSYFSNLLIGGFQGSADFEGNNDGVNSAEESFEWAEYWLDLVGTQHPTILDNFLGEFPLTYS